MFIKYNICDHYGTFCMIYEREMKAMGRAQVGRI